jgi:hypothetical protein
MWDKESQDSEDDADASDNSLRQTPVEPRGQELSERAARKRAGWDSAMRTWTEIQARLQEYARTLK